MEQYNLFDIIDKNLQEKEQTMGKFEGRLRVFEAFAGVGSQRMALRNLNIDHEVVGIAEIDKFALASYKAIHGDCPNYGDISKIDPHELPDMDLFTYSFPCQDLSVAGKQAGLTGGTRSGLLYECEKVIEAKRPKFLLLENVKNLVGKKFKPEFDKWLEYLEGLGYSNYWEVLNAKNYGVPQNRERVFVVSILNDGGYKFPAKQEEKNLKEKLEKEVEEKYYLSEKQIEKIKCEKFKEKGVVIVGSTQKNAYTGNGDICPTLTNAMGTGGGQIPMIKEYKFPAKQELTKRIKDILEPAVDEKFYLNKPFKMVNKENVVAELGIKGHDAMKRIYSKEGHAPTLDTMQGGHREPKILDNYRVRKLTPLECWRLMGFTDQDFYKAQAVCSNSQLYKQAGNSIVVNVLEGIFKSLFLGIEDQVGK